MLPHRESVGVRRSLSRKLHLEFLEGRSMPSSLAGAVLPSNGGADNLSSRDLRASVPSALVSSASIKGSEGQPPLLSAGAPVRALIATVTGSSGALAGRTGVALQTESENQPPVITDFGAVEGPGDYWTFEGTVTDPDDSVEGMVVTFGGVLASYSVSAVVRADGTFSLTQPFPGLETGIASAQTQDPHGALSNTAECWVLVS